MNRKPYVHGPGLIGLACGELARYSDFIPTLVGLQKPAGCGFKLGKGLGPANPFNGIARAFLSNRDYQWLFLTNDDNIIPPHALYQLLDHNVDVVSGLYFGRHMPFEPILFDEWTWEPVEGGERDGDGFAIKKRWWHRHLMMPGEKGLIKAAAVGDGCLLIRRHVLEGLADPWWEYGETFTDVCDHDVVFSRKVTEAGFGLYCDLDLPIGHITSITVTPYRQTDGVWVTKLVQDAGRELVLPAAYKE